MKYSFTRREILARAVASATALGIAGQAHADSVIHEVRITNFAFVPDRLAVRVGDTVTWINDDLVPHTATANDHSWSTGELGQSQLFELTVTADMETDYFCTFHPHMTGTLIFE